MESKFLINKYTFSDGSWVELEDRITPLTEVNADDKYLACMIDMEQRPDGSVKGVTCFVRVEFSNPENWGQYRSLMNEMMTSVMAGETLCAYVEVVHVNDGAITIKHTDGTLALIPTSSQAQTGNMTVH